MPETFWIHKTNKGRIVYDRKTHALSVADAKRICAKILVSGGPNSTGIWAILEEILKFVFDALLTAFGYGPIKEIAWFLLKWAVMNAWNLGILQANFILINYETGEKIGTGPVSV